jgi:hypothetical protein
MLRPRPCRWFELITRVLFEPRHPAGRAPREA